MENQNNIDAGAPAATETLKNGPPAVPEVSSTTAPAEPTKRSLRVQTWRKIQENKAGVNYNTIFNRIPRFVDDEKAAELLANTEEFKKAQNIKVNIDRALNAFKVQTLLAGKNLYLPATRDSSALFLKVDVPADANDEQKKELLHAQDVAKHRIEISLNNTFPLDIVMIGSVVVSRDGYRIGRGNGFTDLDIGLLIDVGCINSNTLIATMVHDLQVVDSLPTNLFQKYDTPVDLIVTPTEVIRVADRLPRPAGVFWELLSERRLKLVPVLGLLRERLLENGKQVTIKEEDTDVEHFQNNNRNRRRGPGRRRFGNRNNQRRAHSQTDTEQQGENNTQPRRYSRKSYRRFPNRRRRATKSEGDHSGVEGGKSQERKQGGQGGNAPANNIRKQKQRRTRVPQRDFCIKLSNLSRDVRVKDVKSELRRRECTPLFLSWKGQYGKCYLHFGNRDGTPSTEDEINKVLKSLSDLSLTVNVDGVAAGNGSSNEVGSTEVTGTESARTKTVNVNVELIKYEKNATAGSGAGNADNGENPVATNGAANADSAAGGDAPDGAAVGHIEPVDTTTV